MFEFSQEKVIALFSQKKLSKHILKLLKNGEYSLEELSC